MRCLLQRVKKASVTVEENVVGSISTGLLILLGVEDSDTDDDINWMVRKIVNMRIFSDENGKMNLSLVDLNGSALVVSQFTLFASTKKGNRPSFTRSAKPQFAEMMYQRFVKELGQMELTSIQSGRFGAHMKVELINDGPVTIWLDSANKE